MALVLASASPRRREIMRLAGYSFSVINPNADESVPENLNAKQVAQQLSLTKAQTAIQLVNDDDVVVCADTIVEIDGQILGKPRSRDEAFDMLKTLSGKTHIVYTGVTVAKSKNFETFSEKTLVTFYELSNSEINNYIDTKEPFDKAGAYGIQGIGCVLVKKIRGDYFNVMGLPIARLSRVLSKYADSL
ncbi:MAG: Septum formation protein Maf [Firmicutes bacterium ADurb.Bin300]|nr:MAG: Septum formation protein Maf [Firmicutes bacterium ADurb.Bin300]